MRPGQLDERITFQRYTSAGDGAGGQVRTWANLASVPSVWAKVQPKGGAEAMMADQQTATQLFLFHVRTRDDLTEADRIVWRGDNYNIRRIERAGPRPMYLVIEAERGVAD